MDEEKIYCKNCRRFTFDIPAEVQAKIDQGLKPFFRAGVHGFCKGCVFGQPPHIEHNESIRCIYFVDNSK